MTANQMLNLWLVMFVITGAIVGTATGYLKARKIQPNGFKWRRLRIEAVVAVINVTLSGLAISAATKWLTAHQVITTKHTPAPWWVIALEYAAYFFGFDTWFYWLHRAMHKEPVYRWVHKVHHWSTAPNLLTNLSENPLESIVNGGFVPLFLSLMTVHDQTLALILPTNIIMGFYVHSGYEFFPRWWHKSWLTKWFITTTFHDQHHKYFTVNFGGYTTIWDRICGTIRPKFEADYDKIKLRPIRAKPSADGGEGATA